MKQRQLQLLSKNLKVEIDKRENEISLGLVKTKTWSEIKKGLIIKKQHK